MVPEVQSEGGDEKMAFDAEAEQAAVEAKIKDLESRVAPMQKELKGMREEAKIKDLKSRIAPMQKELKEMRERYSLLTKIINRAKTT
jgi:predicted  nucleic acid-binding Zn-ribbon protein